jgi:hypothetical protein
MSFRTVKVNNTLKKPGPVFLGQSAPLFPSHLLHPSLVLPLSFPILPVFSLFLYSPLPSPSPFSFMIPPALPISSLPFHFPSFSLPILPLSLLNLQLVMGVFFREDSVECFQDVIKILFDSNYILKEYDDAYIHTKLEKVILVFFNDITINMALKNQYRHFQFRLHVCVTVLLEYIVIVGQDFDNVLETFEIVFAEEFTQH